MKNILNIADNDEARNFTKDVITMGVSELLKSFGDIVSSFPVVSGVCALYKTGQNVHDAFLMKDLADFYCGVYEGDPDENKVISKVADGGHASDLLAEFTLRLIATNNKPGQTKVLGWLYYAVATGEISEEEYMRLCVYIQNCFVADIKRLKEFKQSNSNTDFVTDSYFRAGLLQTKDMLWGGGTVCELSDMGVKLYNILSQHGFFD